MEDSSKPIEVGVDGMTCAACVRRVENGLRKIPTVVQASVNLATERARVQLDHAPSPSDLTAIRDAIRKLGYEPIEISRGAIATGSSSLETQTDRRELETNELWWKFVGAVDTQLGSCLMLGLAACNQIQAMLEAAITFNLTSITNFSTLFHHRISVVISNSRKWYKRGQCNQGEQERYSGHNIGSLGSNRSVLNHSEPCRVEGRFCSENMSFYLRNVWFANFAKNLVFREGHRRRRHLTPILAANRRESLFNWPFWWQCSITEHQLSLDE
jgi:copper chaperone CopZ